MKYLIVKIFLTVFILFLWLGCSESKEKKQSNSSFVLTASDESFLDTLQYKTFRFFLDEVNPENGLIPDRTQDWSASSIAAVGWGVTAWAIGVEHDWISREKAADLTLALLRFLINSEQSTAKDATGYKGFYYHFLNMKTGKREWNCELSTIDTTWLLAGIRFASQYYDKDTEKEKEIRNLADSLVNRVDWDWTIIQKARDEEHVNLVAMGYRPEEGLGDFGWFGYTEALYLYILAAGTNLSNPQKSYQQWLSSYKWVEPYKGLAHVGFPPLFGHQFSHMFIDFRGLADKYLQEKKIDYFENSRRATLANWKYCIDNPNGWAGFDSLTWGISACDGPGDFEKDGKRFFSYAGRGATGPGDVICEDGTITPEAAGGSVPFAPEICIPALKNMYEKYGAKGLWGKYGFKDAFNPTLNWFDKDYLGLDQGPILIMIENYRTGLIWKYAMKDPIIQKGLERLNFSKLADN
ncbi:MAG: Tat pathway signal protein [Ignavibacteriaceae bacterium]|nr:Tat pathway signal protein [Ignavibacteriaceae bacterium]